MFSGMRDMRWLFIIIWAGLPGLPAGAQVSFLSGESGSLKVSGEDSAYIIGELERSQKFEYTRMDSARAIVDSMMLLSRAKGFGYGIGNAFIAHAIYAMTRGAYRESDSLFRAGYPYCYRSAEPGRSNRLLALWYEQRGILASYQGDYDKAIDCSCRALYLLQQQPADSGLFSLKISIYNSIGSVLQYLGQQDKGIYYLKKGEALAIAHKDTNNLAQLYVNFGNAYSGLGQLEQAEAAFRKGILLSSARNNVFVEQVAHLSMAEIGRKKGKYDEAIASLDKALSLSGNTNPYMSRIFPYLLLGDIYLEKNKPALAVQYGSEALATAERIGAAQYIGNANGLLARAFGAQGQWEQAYAHREIERSINDSITSATKIQNINQLEVRSRVAEKDKQLAEQSLSLNRQQASLREKNFWIAGIACCTLLLAALLFSIRKGYRHRRKAQQGQMELVRLKALVEGEEQERGRIAQELHDGVASQLLAVKLNLSTALSRPTPQPEDIKRSLRYLEEAMQDLRQTAHNLMPVTAGNNDLPGMIGDFCNKVSHGTDTDIEFRAYGMDAPVTIDYALPLFRIVQELVQNALKHAAARYILVQLNYAPDLLCVSVEDDGRGFDIQQSGAGLAGLRERIGRLKGTFSVESGPGGTSCYLEFTGDMNAGITNNINPETDTKG